MKDISDIYCLKINSMIYFCVEELKRCGLENIVMIMRRRWLQWYGHVMRRGYDYILRRVFELQIQGRRQVGGPRKTWGNNIEEDMSMHFIIAFIYNNLYYST